MQSPTQERSSGESPPRDIIKYVQSQQSLRVGVTGYTYSAPGAFYGFWWNEQLGTSGDWEPDKIVLLIIDYQISPEHDTYTVSEKLAELKRTIDEAYESNGSPQQDVWVIASTVERYV